MESPSLPVSSSVRASPRFVAFLVSLPPFLQAFSAFGGSYPALTSVCMPSSLAMSARIRPHAGRRMASNTEMKLSSGSTSSPCSCSASSHAAASSGDAYCTIRLPKRMSDYYRLRSICQCRGGLPSWSACSLGGLTAASWLLFPRCFSIGPIPAILLRWRLARARTYRLQAASPAGYGRQGCCSCAGNPGKTRCKHPHAQARSTGREILGMSASRSSQEALAPPRGVPRWVA